MLRPRLWLRLRQLLDAAREIVETLVDRTAGLGLDVVRVGVRLRRRGVRLVLLDVGILRYQFAQAAKYHGRTTSRGRR